MKRKPLLLGNWKMNTTPEEGRLLVRQMAPMIQDAVHIPLDWGLAVPYPHLGLLAGDYRDWETDRKSTRLNSSH